MNTQNKEAFTAWLCREMPAGTVIGDPAWWAPKIIAALSAPPDAQPVAWAVYSENGNLRIWFNNIEAARRWSKANEFCGELVPLYAHPSPTNAPASESPTYAELEALYQGQCECADEWSDKYHAEVEKRGEQAENIRILELEAALASVNTKLIEANLAAQVATSKPAETELHKAATRYLASVNEAQDVELEFSTTNGVTEYERARRALQKALKTEPDASEAAQPLTYTVDGVVLSMLEYIDYLHGQLASKAPVVAVPDLTDSQIDEAMAKTLPNTRPSKGFRHFARAVAAISDQGVAK